MQQEIRQQFLHVPIQIGKVIVDIESPAPMLQRFQIGRNRLAVGVPQNRGVRDKVAACFQINETNRSFEIKGKLLPVQQMEGGHVMLVEFEMLETFQQRGGFGEKIGDYNDQAPLLDAFGKFVKRLDDIGFALRLRLAEGVENGAEVGAGVFRLEVLQRLVTQPGAAASVD